MNPPEHRPSVRDRNEAYLSRVLVALVTVLLTGIVLVRLPWAPEAQNRVGWQVITSDEVIALENVRFEEGLSAAPGIVFEQPQERTVAPVMADEPVAGTEDGEEEEAEVESAGEPQQNRVERMERLVLAAAETMPEIRGGLGAYYINIRYPQKAIDEGIEGRLVLDFIVEKDGRASDILVYQSLHPLCDSAAVQALRQTLFMPGRSGGEAVAVRMRLPVLFQIVPTAGSSPDSVGSRL
ncbi:MAG: energy transducer TonB [Rhodothermales bacterium]|nr:energy transducer TonB [Rhodothermales bacterium]MBO6781266.1 energy transducer TonB [Rhodothermales bacterium]